jgi:hypothetical protein
MTMPRIREADALYLLFDELCQEALRLEPWDADTRDQWFDRCRQVLDEVPDFAQRLAWQYTLAQRFSLQLPGVNFDLVMALLRLPHVGGRA